MAEQQLQLGDIERLDGLGNPLGAIAPPSGEQAPAQDSVAAPVQETVESPFDNYLDGSVDSGTDFTRVPQELGVLPTDGQLSGIAEQYNLAMVSNSSHITPEDVMDMVRRDITPYDVQNALAALSDQAPEYRRIAAFNLIGDPRLTVEAKMDLLREVDALGQKKDVNYVTKQAQVNSAAADYMDDDEPDAEGALAHSIEQVSLQSNDVAPPPVLPEDIFNDIRQLYQEADNQESFLDYVEQMTPVGSLPTLNKVVSDIYSDLGLNSPAYSASDARPWLLVGNAFVELRGMIRQAGPVQRAEIAKVVYKRLKENTGIMQDHNDVVVMQVLQNLFPQEITGSDPFAAREEEKTPEQLGELDKQIAAVQAKLDVQFGPDAPTPEQRKTLASDMDELLGQRYGLPSGRQVANNVFNLLDWTAVGGLVKGTGKLIRSLPKLLEGMSHTSPQAAARKAAEGVLDVSGDTAARLGAKPVDLAENFLANGASDVVINRGVNGFAAMTEQMQEQARALVRSLQPLNLTAAEREVALADISRKYSPDILAKTHSVKLHLNQSAVQLSEDGTSANVTAVFGATPYRGYSTLEAARVGARGAIEDVFGKGAPVEIIQKAKDGTWKIVPEGFQKGRGEFFLRVRDSRSLASSETYGTIGLADDATDKLTLSAGAAHWTRGLNIFNDFHYDQISARVRQSSFSGTVWRGLMEPLTKLKTSDKQLLSKIIRENEGTELATDALELAAGGNKAVADGYRRFVQIGNIAYHLEDSLKRTAYLREGMSDLYHRGQRIGFGKPLTSTDAVSGSRKKVFDPETGKFSTMTTTDIDGLYKRGGSLARMKHPVRGKDNIEDALVVLDPKTRGQVKPVPMSGVQAKIPGYYPHMTNRNFVVYAVDRTGKRVPKAVSFTQDSAMRFVEKKNGQLANLRKKGKGLEWKRYEVGFDAALTRNDTYAQHLDELESGFSQIMFGKRKDGALTQLDNWMEEAELDPIAAMLRATEILSTRITKGEMLQSMRQRVWNSLHTGKNKQFLKNGSATKSYNQLTLDDLVEASPDADGLKRHQAMLHRINNMEQSPDFWQAATRNTYRGMAQLAHKLGLKGAEAGAYRLAKSGPNPVSIGLAWLHRMYISAFATKQFVLQVMQSAATAGLLSPGRYAQSIYQGMSIIPAVVMKTGAMHGKRVPGFSLDMLKTDDFFSKSIGMGKKEYNRLVDIIIERGLIDSVGANTMVKAAINDAADAAARRRASIPRKGVGMAVENARDALGPLAPLTRARTYDQAVFGTLNKLGWEGGERINQILSMLTLYNRDRAAGTAKLFDEAYVDSLIGRTAELTGNMVKEAGFGYTHSVLKPFMLWVPFQHKMILQALPKRIGGMQRFSFNEKARMVLGQFLLYGANATAVTAGIHQAIERGVVERLEARPEGERNAFVQFWRNSLTKDVLEGMVFDWFGNKTIQALWGEGETPSDMAWGRALAPGAGHEFVREKVTALASADWKGALGVQGNYASKLARYLGDVSNVVTARMKDFDDMSMQERMGQMTQRGLVDLVPIYGKWTSARWAVAHGMFISENGTLSEPFGNAIEAKLQFLLGVDSKNRTAYYETTDRLRQDFEDEGKATKAGEQAADIYWKQLIATAVKADKEVPSDDMWQAAMDQWMLDQGLMLSVLGAREKEVFSKRIEAKIDKLAAGQGDSAEMVMMERFTNKLREGGYGEDGPRAAAYFRHLPFVKENPQFLDMLEASWNEIAHEPVPENITEDYLEGEQ